MPKSKKKRSKRKADPLRVEFSLRGKGKKPTLQEAIAIFRVWAETGKTPTGMRIAVVRWQNPARKNPELRNWRTAETPSEIKRARETLHLGSWLRGAETSISPIRIDRVSRRSASDSSRPRQKKSKKLAPAKRRRGIPRRKNAKSKRKKRALPSHKRRNPSSGGSPGKSERLRTSGAPGSAPERSAQNAAVRPLNAHGAIGGPIIRACRARLFV